MIRSSFKIDFDASDEVGEIAQAFNEITEKFRKSQESLAEQERLQKEMQVAQEIQHTLLPAAFPDIEGYEIASYYEAAKEVGGDYFDFVEVDKDTLGIVVADVSGKGVPGSLVMTMIRTALRTEARGNKNAADVLSRVNDFVINDMKRGMFVTVFYIILDSKNRTINYASAGHNPMILYRGSTKKSYYLNPRGFPIGINLPDKALFRKSIESDTLRLQEGDVLIVYTDGITEAMNPLREKFSEERFLEVIRENGHLKVDPLVDKIRDQINTFTEGYAQNDDITLVSIREKMRAEDVLFNLRSRLMEMVNEDGMTVKEACRTVGVSTSTYYKYKKRFKEMGVDGLKEKVSRSEIEEKHISIEDKAKIYDIIKEHPEYGAKRISEELNTDKYGLLQIDERKIYEELVRSRLNTKDLRMSFVERGGHRKRMKPPGTPFLTLDGQVIVGSREVAVREEDEETAVRVEQKSGLVKRVSQRPPEDEESRDAEEKEERPGVLDAFLGLAETYEEGGVGEETEDIATLAKADAERGDEAAGELDLNLREEGHEEAFLKTEKAEDSALGEEAEAEEFSDLLIGPEEFGDASVGEEPHTSDREIGEEETALPVDLGIDEVFDEMIEGIVGIREEDDHEDADGRRNPLDEILQKSNGASWDLNGDQVEDGISTSIAGDLLDDEMSRFDITDIDDGGTPSFGEEFSVSELDADLARELGFKSGYGKDDFYKTNLDTIRQGALEPGLQLYREGRYPEALQEFQKALKEFPRLTEAYQCLGDTYFRMGLLDEAKEAYERVRRSDPENVSVLENLGVIFANRGDYKKAVWQWGEVLKRNPDRRDIINRIKKMQRVIRQRYL